MTTNGRNIALATVFWRLLITARPEQPTFTPRPAKEGPVVSTNVGKIVGVTRSVKEGGDVHAFTGIPYAKPPVGDLRYRGPQPVTTLGEGVFDATKMPPACMQVTVVKERYQIFIPYDLPKSEDCLYVNVWTPILNNTPGLPVMAWLHGGGFQDSSAAMSLFDGGNLAALGGVVVVTIGYRLQSFGFLYDGTEDAPGNQGVRDQALALRWVQDNILAFGGDPKEVTLFGWSAGGIATGFHLISPKSEGLFTRAIILSAGVTNKGRVRETCLMLKYSKKFAAIFGCYHNSTETRSSANFVACLRQKNGTLLSVMEQNFVDGGQGMFEPIFGDGILPVEPHVAEFPGDKNIMIGMVANEGSELLYIKFRDTFSQVLAPRNISKQEMLYYLRSLYSKLSLQELLQLQETYMEGIAEFDYAALRQALAEIRGDAHVTCGSLHIADKLSNATATSGGGKNVYFYMMEYLSPCSKRQSWYGMTHGDDLPLVFGRPFDKEGGCSMDIPFSKEIINIWSNFAKGRTPAAADGTAWPRYSPDSRYFLKLTEGRAVVSSFDVAKRCDVLKKLKLY